MSELTVKDSHLLEKLFFCFGPYMSATKSGRDMVMVSDNMFLQVRILLMMNFQSYLIQGG